MLHRILEPEVMDTAEDAREYDSMDHTAVNETFVTDLLAALDDRLSGPCAVLDLGAGTAQIPIELARRVPNIHITAVDAAPSMLALANENIIAAGLDDRITFLCGDAKNLPFTFDSPFSRDAKALRSGARLPHHATHFNATISNSILHHIPEPRDVIAEAVRVTAPGGLLFHRDLCRPTDENELTRIVETYAASATTYQRKLFTDSLHAALSLNEIQSLVATFGFNPDTACMTSDRHWTWCATNDSPHYIRTPCNVV